jgi:hypothetical protein
MADLAPELLGVAAARAAAAATVTRCSAQRLARPGERREVGGARMAACWATGVLTRWDSIAAGRCVPAGWNRCQLCGAVLPTIAECFYRQRGEHTSQLANLAKQANIAESSNPPLHAVFSQPIGMSHGAADPSSC